MNPIMVQLASGVTGIAGLIVLVIVASIRSPARSRRGQIGRNVVALIAVIIVIASATPFPLSLYAVFLASITVWLVVENIDRFRTQRTMRLSRVAVVIVALGLIASEVPYTVTPTLRQSMRPRLYVIGDSISAGLGPERPRWPDRLAAKYHVAVTNLAMPGATAEDALLQAAKIAEPAALVLVEIGGNDLFYGRSSRRFREDLDRLLGRLRGPERTIVMLELPLFPFYDAFGRAQRAMARKHDVLLIPKRHFARVLSAPGATEDGLHLSATGADAMADTLYPMLAPALAQRR